MCGITGTYFAGQVNKFQVRSAIESMTAALNHRGPDDSGIWLDPNISLALGHRRLSIIDLSPMGAQPMVSADGRFVIVYNGEVYNFMDLRYQLENIGCVFKGYSDTEVILEAISQWGVSSAVKRFVGMFAFAVWDNKEKKLFLVRDRLGIKPLYYGHAGSHFVFASELKAITAHPNFTREIDLSSLPLFFHYGYFPAPYCIYKNVFTLIPGEILTLSQGHSNALYSERFWSPHQAFSNGCENPFRGSIEDAEDELDRLLADSVKSRMISHVPLGAFLSGGIDSSIVVSLMQSKNTNKVNTFTIGFHEDEFNEAKFAKRVAEYLGTQHTEMYISHADALEVIPRLAEMYDEPFADSSQIPSYLISSLTKKHVTVAQSGDGGDELFCGYNHYKAADEVWRLNNRIPRSLRKLVSVGASTLSQKHIPVFIKFISKIMNHYGRNAPNSALSLLRWSKLLTSSSFSEYYRYRMMMYPAMDKLLTISQRPETAIRETPTSKKLLTNFEKMMYYDTLQYLPDDILTKVDRASMSVSLEVRVPIIDHRVVEFAASLPLDMKYHNGIPKYLLKQVLSRYVPRDFFERPKKGFGVPVSQWVTGPLRDWAEELLRYEELELDGIFQADTVRAMWHQHSSGKQNHFPHLWTVLMFQAWRKRWLSSPKSENKN